MIYHKLLNSVVNIVLLGYVESDIRFFICKCLNYKVVNFCTINVIINNYC